VEAAEKERVVPVQSPRASVPEAGAEAWKERGWSTELTQREGGCREMEGEESQGWELTATE